MNDSSPSLLNQAQFLLEKTAYQSQEELQITAVELAKIALELSEQKASFKEKFTASMLASLMDDPVGKYFTTCLMDRFFRSSHTSTQWKQFSQVKKKTGIPSFLPLILRSILQKTEFISKYAPFLGSKLFRAVIKWQTKEVIAEAKATSLKRHLKKRRKEKIRINLNHLGEAILGEKEAQKRLETYIKDLESPLIEYISVKISTLYSQINLLSKKTTLSILKERLSKLYEVAGSQIFIDHLGNRKTKFVNLDMEEFSDLDLTIDLFKETLENPSFNKTRAGIVLQSYLPNSWEKLLELIEFSKKRVENGNSPIKIRLVKGANLAMEQLQARVKGWKQAPYPEKKWVDANFKRMLHTAANACQKKELILGVGSHNLFDVCYAMALRSHMKLENFLELEMLEGMAPQIRKAIHAIAGDMLLYCPAATEEEFSSAIAYLVRRLDENTGPENFLRDFFHISQNQDIFDKQAKAFTESFLLIEKLEEKTFRKPRPLNFSFKDALSPQEILKTTFKNEPDTDWAIPENALEMEVILKNSQFQNQKLPLLIAGRKIYPDQEGLSKISYEDPSQRGSLSFETPLASWSLVDQALESAQEAAKSWKKTGARERAYQLIPLAQALRSHRGTLIALMVATLAKRAEEADAEVSEAIDFVEYYCRQVIELDEIEGLQLNSRGVALITPPWNFPLAIALGSILGALLTGNVVLFKPSPEGYAVGYKLASILWERGISENLLQVFSLDEASVGLQLLQDPRVNLTVLTGSSQTAQLFLNLAPSRPLIAETGGKNVMILSPTCDRDLAIKDLIQSAFSYNGQKCSCVSLALIHKEIYEDPKFWAQLVDATQSLVVGSAHNFQSKITPLIAPAQGKLLWALTELEKEQKWVIQPIQESSNTHLWSPGIVKDVQRGQRRHLEEFFGPILGLMSYKTLEEAIEIINQTPYGLTSGLHTLNEEESEIWTEAVKAGNLYVNRSTTGAIVQRQPFGGTKASRIGIGRKAGGPQYLLSFYAPGKDSTPGKEKLPYPEKLYQILSQAPLHLQKDLEAIFKSYTYWYLKCIRKEDFANLAGQENFYYLIAQENYLLRFQRDDTTDEKDFWCALAAGALAQNHLRVSASKWPSTQKPPSFIDFYEESEDWIENKAHQKTQTVRIIGDISKEELVPLAKRSLTILLDPVCYHGRYEILHPLREISFCRDYHRYGNLGLQPQHPPVI